MTFWPIAVEAAAYNGLEGWNAVRWREEDGRAAVRGVEREGLAVVFRFRWDMEWTRWMR